MIRVVIQERPPAPSDLVRVTRFPTGFLPAGTLFTPLLADPRWPHFSLEYRYYLGRRRLVI